MPELRVVVGVGRRAAAGRCEVGTPSTATQQPALQPRRARPRRRRRSRSPRASRCPRTSAARCCGSRTPGPGKQLEIAESGSVLGGLPAARWCSCAVQVARLDAHGVASSSSGRPVRATSARIEVDLAPRERQVAAVGAAHHRRHLAPPAVGQVADLVVVAQHVGEPRRGAAAQRDEQALVQVLERRRVDERAGHDRLERAPARVLATMCWPCLAGAFIAAVFISRTRLEGAADDLLDRARASPRSPVDVGPEQRLLELVGDRADRQRVRRVRRRSGADRGRTRVSVRPPTVSVRRTRPSHPSSR